MITVYLLRTDIFLREEQMLQGCREIDAVRLAKVNRCRGMEDKARSLCCGLLLQYAVRRYLGIKEKTEIRYGYGEYGKPYLADYPDLHFNLSHSGSCVCGVFADREVGIDLQKIRPLREGLVKRTLSEQEYVRYKNMASPEEKTDWFFRCWCAKESYAKLIGKGLSCDFRGICLEQEQGRILPGGVCREYRPADGYYMNVCAWEKDGSVRFPQRSGDVTGEVAEWCRD